jgi:hypothetical protein
MITSSNGNAVYGTKHTKFSIPEHGGITNGMKRLVRRQGELIIQTNYNSKGWKDIYVAPNLLDGLLDLFHDDARMILMHIIDSKRYH